MTMGLIFMTVGAATYFWGPVAQPMHPPAIAERPDPDRRPRASRLSQLPHPLRRGPGHRAVARRSSARASVRRCAPRSTICAWRRSIGINTSRLFALTFALGSGLAALGGALGADLLAIGPGYALDNLVYFLIVVAVGGLGSIRGPFVAALLVGIADTAFKYIAARARRLLHLRADHGDPAVAAARPVRSRVMAARRSSADDARRCSTASRAGIACVPFEALPWLMAIAAFFVFPDYLALRRADPRHHPVRALASTSCSAMPASSRLGTPPSSASAPIPPASSRPTAGASRSPACSPPPSPPARSASSPASSSCAPPASRSSCRRWWSPPCCTSSPTRRRRITGGADGLQGMEVWPIFGVFRFDLFGRTAYHLLPRRAVHRLAHRAHDRALAVRPLADRHSRKRAAHARDRRAGRAAQAHRLHDLGGARRHLPAR